MGRIVHKLHREQLLASVAVVVVAAVAFAFLAFVGGGQQSHMETDAVVDGIQSQVVQLGAIHSSIVNTGSVNGAGLASFAQTRQQIETDLVELHQRIGNSSIYVNLDEAVSNYLSTLDKLVAAAQAGSLGQESDLVKRQAALDIFNVGFSIREARAELGAQAAESWRTAKLGFIGAIAFLVFTVLAITRITERRLQRVLLERERDRLDNERHLQFAALVENISDAIAVIDRSGNITYASPATETLLGREVAKIQGMPWSGFVHPDDRSSVAERLAALADDGKDAESETLVVRVQQHDGQWAWIEAIATNHVDVLGINGIVVNARDITERRRSEESLRYRAFHDPLTGLANRTVLTEHVQKALQRRRRMGSTFAVMFVDLDDFKYINDTWGHATGDDLLVTISERLRSVLREVDMAARLGGDEFVLVVNDLDSEEAALTVADRVHQVLTAPFEIGKNQFHISASIGIAISGRCPDETVEDILRDADIAMYRAKREGRNRSHVYSTRGDTGRLIAISA